MDDIVLNVNGMMCEGCENRIKNSLKLIEGVERVKASHVTGKVEISCSKDVSIDEIKETIIDLGYEIK